MLITSKMYNNTVRENNYRITRKTQGKKRGDFNNRCKRVSYFTVSCEMAFHLPFSFLKVNCQVTFIPYSRSAAYQLFHPKGQVEPEAGLTI